MSEQAVNEKTEELDVNTTELQDKNPTEGEGQQDVDGEGFEVIDGNDHTPGQTVPLRTFLSNKEKWKKREEQRRVDAEALRQENELLRLQLEQKNKPKPKADKPPVPEEFSTAEEHTAALTEYIRENGAEAARQFLQQQQEEQQKATRAAVIEQQHDQALDQFYERAAKLKATDFEAAEEAFIQTFGREAALSLIGAIDNSEAVVYALGKNTAKAQEFAQKLKANPVAGLVAITQYASKLQIKPRTAKAPEPDEPERGASGGGDLQAQLDALRKRRDQGKASMQDVINFKREAQAKGVRLI